AAILGDLPHAVEFRARVGPRRNGGLAGRKHEKVDVEEAEAPVRLERFELELLIAAEQQDGIRGGRREVEVRRDVNDWSSGLQGVRQRGTVERLVERDLAVVDNPVPGARDRLQLSCDRRQRLELDAAWRYATLGHAKR